MRLPQGSARMLPVIWCLLGALALTSTSALGICDRVRRALKLIAEPVSADESFATAYNFPASLKPRLLEARLAADSDLPLADVVALTRNFSDDVVAFDGSYGVYVQKSKVKVDGDLNLPGAYKLALASLADGVLTVDKLIAIRDKAMEAIQTSVKTPLVKIPAQFKKGGFTVRVKGRLKPENQAKLARFGITAEQVEAGIINVTYPANWQDAAFQRDLLQREYIDPLNAMLARRDDPLQIATFAVQQLLLIHSFDNGNGRTARLLGQVLFRQLTQTVVLFPAAFHAEMDYSESDLVNSLRASAQEH